MYAGERRRSIRFSDDPFLCSRSCLANSRRVLRRRFANCRARRCAHRDWPGLLTNGSVRSRMHCVVLNRSLLKQRQPGGTNRRRQQNRGLGRAANKAALRMARIQGIRLALDGTFRVWQSGLRSFLRIAPGVIRFGKKGCCRFSPSSLTRTLHRKSRNTKIRYPC
jgi:hypothetical protein